MANRVAPFLLMALLVLAGCKSSQHAGANLSATKTAAGATVPVEPDDYVIRMPETVPPGEIVLQIHNVGKHDHNIKISDPGVEAQVAHNLKPGETAELRVTLAPGVYHVTCPVGPHAALGMRMELTVRSL